MSKQSWLLPFFLALPLGWPPLASGYDQGLVESVTTCFDQLADEVDTYVQDNDVCSFDVTGQDDGEAELTVNSIRRNDLMTSTLSAFTRVWSNNFLLEPTDDANTFRINPVSPAGETRFVVPVYGGVYAYAYLAGAEVHMVRCNEQLASCVIYVEIAEYTKRTLQYSNQCFVIMMLSFPVPEHDEEIARYMSSVLEFMSHSVGPVNPARFLPACADHRPGEGIDAES